MLFLSLTTEEKGLLGSRYYAQNPLYPLTQTVAVTNLDGANQFGRTSDIEVIGFGASTIDDIGLAIAREHQVSDEVKPDWTFEGAAQDAEFLLQVGLHIANGDKWPEWKPGNEFKGKRDVMLNNR